MWASFQRIIELFIQNLSLSSKKIWGWDLGSGIRDLGSGIREKTYSGSRIRVQGSIRHQIPDPGFRIRIRNTVLEMGKNNKMAMGGSLSTQLLLIVYPHPLTPPRVFSPAWQGSNEKRCWFDTEYQKGGATTPSLSPSKHQTFKTSGEKKTQLRKEEADHNGLLQLPAVQFVHSKFSVQTGGCENLSKNHSNKRNHFCNYQHQLLYS